MEDHYGMADLRQFMSNTSFFTSLPPPQQQLSADMLLPHHYEMVLAPMAAAATGLHREFLADSSTNAAATTASGGGASSGGAGFSGLELETGVGGGGRLGFDGSGSGRWPRQETLTLLEIRSRLDPKFKEANHKGPLWDEVSRIMSEEHGYRRTGKKCREKFENLYKYYKKTKDGKAGRQDGKHYRFFRQLEALYGNNNGCDQTNHKGSDYITQNHHQTDSGGNANFYGRILGHDASKQAADDGLSLSKCSDFGSTSSGEEEDGDDSGGEKERKRKGRRRRWKLKIKEFIDEKMRKLVEKQDVWLEKMMSGIEEKEQERMAREEEWRKQEVDRMEREQRFWANERAWIEARDAALMEALHKLAAGNKAPTDDVIQFDDQNWATPAAGDARHEITKLIQLRTNMESRFQQHIGCSDDVLWEEIAAKMSYMGYDNAASMCKDKWLSINNYFLNKGNYKKRKENSNNNDNSGYCFNQYNLFHNNEGSYSAHHHHHHQQQPPNDNNHPNSLRFLMGDNSNAENMWEGYELKQSKGAE